MKRTTLAASPILTNVTHLAPRNLTERRFIVLGDSYSAGPGAGAVYDCVKLGRTCYRLVVSVWAAVQRLKKRCYRSIRILFMHRS
jgi:hypothetical protein